MTFRRKCRPGAPGPATRQRGRTQPPDSAVELGHPTARVEHRRPAGTVGTCPVGPAAWGLWPYPHRVRRWSVETWRSGVSGASPAGERASRHTSEFPLGPATRPGPSGVTGSGADPGRSCRWLSSWGTASRRRRGEPSADRRAPAEGESPVDGMPVVSAAGGGHRPGPVVGAAPTRVRRCPRTTGVGTGPRRGRDRTEQQSRERRGTGLGAYPKGRMGQGSLLVPVVGKSW